MAKIKIRDIEGDAEEIKNLLKDFGCDLNSYISTNPVKNKVSNIWLFILGGFFFVVACLVWCDIFNPTWTKVSILALFLLLGIISFIIHNNHDNWTFTAIPIVTGLCLILISLNVYTPQELAKRLEDKAIKKISTE